MKVNNLEKILLLLTFESENTFYFVQVLQRAKENPDLGKNSRVIKHYYIKSKEHLVNYFGEMMQLAHIFNARVCINLNARSFERMGFSVMQKIANQMMNKDYYNIKDAYSSVCGTLVPNQDKRWIVDVDTHDVTELFNVGEKIMEISKSEKTILEVLDTPNGYHIITSPFRVDEFKKYYPDIDIHKNNPTILYSNTK